MTSLIGSRLQKQTRLSKRKTAPLGAAVGQCLSALKDMGDRN